MSKTTKMACQRIASEKFASVPPSPAKNGEPKIVVSY